MKKYYFATLVLTMIAFPVLVRGQEEKKDSKFDSYIKRKLKIEDPTVAADATLVNDLTANAAAAVQSDNIDYGPRIRAVFSIGPSYSLMKVDDPYLSPLDSTLHFQSINRWSCVVSGGVAIPFGRGAIHADKEEAGNTEFHQHPARLAAIVLLNASNLVAFTGTNTPFNQKVNGGLGVGYSLNREDNSLLLGFTVDFNSARQLRDHYYQFEGKQITYGTGSNTKAYGQLDVNNNQLYYDKLTIGLTLRLVYVISGKKTNGDN